MSNHTGTVCACQDYAHPPREETTPAPSSISPESSDRRLVQRYGIALLTGGYTAIPTYAWVYYARLGVSEAEMVLIAQLCTYWWSVRDPFPGEAALAARMGKTIRTIQGYLRSLEGKGLLHIQTRLSTRGQQHTNTYDLRPFFRAVEGLARLDGLLDEDTTPIATTAANGSPDRDRPHRTDDIDAGVCGPYNPSTIPNQEAKQKSLCAGTTSFGTENGPKGSGTPAAEGDEGSCAVRVKNLSPQVNPIEIETFDYDSIPPTPTNANRGNARFRTMTSARDDGAQLPSVAAPARPDDVDGQALAAEIAALGAELGDDAPVSSVTRADNLRRDAGVSPARFLHLLDEAAARTRDRQASIVKRRRDGQASNGMPYLFAVLQDLLHPVPVCPPAYDGGPDRRHAERPGRRRRRRNSGRGEPTGSYAAWSDSPAPLPIVEEHPVWRAILDELAQIMTSENFNAWLATTRALGQEGEVLRVEVPTAFHKTWLEHKLAGKVLQALQALDDERLHERAERVTRIAYVVGVA